LTTPTGSVTPEHDFISTRVNALTDLAGDPQVKANDYISRLPHPNLGEWSYVTTPLEFSKTPVSIRNCAPQLGKDNAELLQSWLGLCRGGHRRSTTARGHLTPDRANPDRPRPTLCPAVHVGSAVHVKKLQDQLQQRNTELDRMSRTDGLLLQTNVLHGAGLAFMSMEL
jgi:hypothetical protein